MPGSCSLDHEPIVYKHQERINPLNRVPQIYFKGMHNKQQSKCKRFFVSYVVYEEHERKYVVEQIFGEVL